MCCSGLLMFQNTVRGNFSTIFSIHWLFFLTIRNKTEIVGALDNFESSSFQRLSPLGFSWDGNREEIPGKTLWWFEISGAISLQVWHLQVWNLKDQSLIQNFKNTNLWSHQIRPFFKNVDMNSGYPFNPRNEVCRVRS